MAGVTGDFAGLAALQKQRAAVAAKGRRVAIKAMAAEATDLVAEGFRVSVSPSGARWRPLAQARARNRRKGDRGKPLVDTGRLRASVTTRPRVGEDGFAITADPIYAATHQYGRGAIPARPFLPLPDLPAAWRERLADAAREAMATLISA